MKKILKVFTSTIVILSITCTLYRLFYKSNTRENIVDEQLTFQNINSSPHYQLENRIEVDGETIIYNRLLDKGDKLLVDVNVINDDVKFKLLYDDYTLVLGYHDKPILMDNYDYLDGQAYFKMNDLKFEYNQIIIQSNSDANKIYVIEVK